MCIGTIREELGDDKALKAKSTEKSEDRESGKIKALILSKYGKIEASTNISLIEEIEKAQTKAKDKAESKFGNKLSEGCKDVYQMSFKGTNTDLGKLANKFCTKPTNKDKLVGGGLSIDKEDLDTEGAEKVTEAKKENEIKKIIENDDEKKKLKDGCKGQFKQLISDTTSEDSKDTATIERIKKLCVLTNKEKIKGNQITINEDDSNSDKSTGTGKMENIKNKSNSDLEEIIKKHKETTDNNAGKELRAGCKSIQDKGYEGEDDADFKLAQEICTNP